MNFSTSSYFLFYLLYSDSHNGRDRELHDLHVVGLLQGGDGSLGIKVHISKSRLIYPCLDAFLLSKVVCWFLNMHVTENMNELVLHYYSLAPLQKERTN